MDALGKGNIWIRTKVKGEEQEFVMMDVLYVPELRLNLYSPHVVTEKGYEIKLKDTTCVILKDQVVKIEGEKLNKFWYLKVDVIKKTEHSANVVQNLEKWHRRMGHQNSKHVEEVLKEHNIPYKKEDFFCESCVMGKQAALPYPETGTRHTAPGELIHTDVNGPMEVPSLGGSWYFVIFKDDYSHYRKIYMLKNKGEVKNKLEEYIQSVKTETGHKVKVLRSDQGKEIVNKHCSDILKKYGIQAQTTVGYAPQQNGSAEREMRTIVEGARMLLEAKQLPKSFWAEAANTMILN